MKSLMTNLNENQGIIDKLKTKNEELAKNCESIQSSKNQVDQSLVNLKSEL